MDEEKGVLIQERNVEALKTTGWGVRLEREGAWEVYELNGGP